MVDIKDAATRKIGPLPAWAWGAVIGGGLIVYRMATGGGSSSSSVQTLAGGLGDAGSGGGGGGGSNIQDAIGGDGAGTGTTPTPTVTIPGYPGDYPQPNVPLSAYTDWLSALRLSDPTAYAAYTAAPPAGSGAGGELWWLKQLKYTDADAYNTYLAAHPALTMPTAPGTGDTSANQPPTLGLPVGQAIARSEQMTYAASRFLAVLPDTPTAPITIPGTYSPTLIPVVRVQGDTARYQDVRGLAMSPRGWVVAARARLRQEALPTTSNRPLVLPPSVRDAIGRVTAPRNG